MSFNKTVYKTSSTNYNINGKSYDNYEDIPEEEKALIEDLLSQDLFSDEASRTENYSFNGKEYSSFDELPEEAKNVFNSMKDMRAGRFDNVIEHDKVTSHVTHDLHQGTVSEQNINPQPSAHEAGQPPQYHGTYHANQAPRQSAVQKRNKNGQWLSIVAILVLIGFVVWSAFK
ncbi:hypothetical protein [Kangiella shandongensis]|uniref:hypothetical protein n=1 Tax=Kangiella shandongensis TaxID=2763258 RepID=UPI001CBB203F|nr:hypothetical protein [Kangiella shandongensis]